MKSGDLVKMTYTSFWQKKSNHRVGRRLGIPYTEAPMLVYESAHNMVKLILPDGTIKNDLAQYYEVINDK